MLLQFSVRGGLLHQVTKFSEKEGGILHSQVMQKTLLGVNAMNDQFFQQHRNLAMSNQSDFENTDNGDKEVSSYLWMYLLLLNGLMNHLFPLLSLSYSFKERQYTSFKQELGEPSERNRTN